MGATSPTSHMRAPRNPIVRVLGLTIICLLFIIYTLRPSNNGVTFTENLADLPNGATRQSPIGGKPRPLNSAPRPLDCKTNSTELAEWQEKYGLGETLSYGRRYVRFQRQDIERESLTKLDHDLFPQGFDLVDVHDPPAKTICLEPFQVPVPDSPYPFTVDASDFLFGISTTFGRLNDPRTGPLKEWAHWLTDGHGHSNGAGLILRLIDATEEQIGHTSDRMRAMGIDAKVYATDSSIEMAKRYLSLLPVLYHDDSRSRRKWLVMCDDDTFFPSMHALTKRLAKFDYRTDLYIGTFSEDVNNIQRHGSQAFGGAGVFFSLSLAEQVSKRFHECSTDEKIQEANTGWGPQGDILLRKCIYEHSEVRLTMLRDLHQLDIQGDPSGFYESGLEPLSLHHFKGGMWHTAHPYEGAHIIHACGEACFLQRFQTADNFIISNGYSVAYYPNGIDFNVHQVERTFSAAPDDYGWNLDFMLGPQRKNLLWTGRKASWELRESKRMADGGLKQIYIRKADDTRWTVGMGGEPMFDVDGVVELIWIP